MKKKIILTDADGVLLNWLARFDEYMASIGYKLKPGTDNHYSMTYRYDITDDEAYSLIKEYNKSPFIAELSPYADAQEYIAKLVEHGFKFVCITSLSSDPKAYEYRKQNLTNLFGDVFQELICLESGSAKEHVLKLWTDSDFFWIEDHIKNAEAGHALGLKSILVQQGHNGHYATDQFHVVGPDHPWKEIYHLVCKDYDLIP